MNSSICSARYFELNIKCNYLFNCRLDLRIWCWRRYLVVGWKG